MTSKKKKLQKNKGDDRVNEDKMEVEESKSLVISKQNEIPLHIPKPDLTENLPWVEKYRPKDFDEVISHGQILDTSI